MVNHPLHKLIAIDKDNPPRAYFFYKIFSSLDISAPFHFSFLINYLDLPDQSVIHLLQWEGGRERSWVTVS